MASLAKEDGKFTNLHVALDNRSDDGSNSTNSDISSSDDEVGEDDLTDHRPSGKYRTFRHEVYRFLNPHFEEKATLSTFYQMGAAVVIVGLFIVDNTTDPYETAWYYQAIEMALLVVWSTEHVLRLWSCVEQDASDKCYWSRCRVRCAFGCQPFMILEFVSLVSLVVDLILQSNSYRGMAALRMMRLFTLYRIERDFNIFTPVIGVLYDKRKELIATLSIAFLVLSIASIIMFYIEAPSNDQFNTVLMSMWWCVTALTTVGYGDIVPQTGPGRVVASLVAFMGTGMFGLTAAVLADGFREAISKEKAASKGDPGVVVERQQDIVALLEERLRMHEEASIARTMMLQKEIQGLRSDLQLSLQSNAWGEGIHTIPRRTSSL